MSNGGQSWAGSAEIDPEFARAAFHSGYDSRRAEQIARQDHVLLDAFYTKLDQQFFGRSRILEFGCELTGGSNWLSEAGPLVIADLVAEELIAANKRLKKPAGQDIDWIFLRHSDDINALPPCDLFYSALSIKNTPPTVLTHVLSLLLDKVTAGGIALLHAPTQHRHHQLMVENAQEFHDLYVVPQWKLFDLLEMMDFRLVLVQENNYFRGADIIYHTILAQRRP
jgi:hypothetical protein